MRVAYFFTAIICLFCSVALHAQNSCFPVFQKVYGSTGNEDGLDIVSTTDKGSFVVGRTTSGSAGGYDGFAMRLNEQGDIVWSYTIGGGNYDDLVKARQTADGGFVALGNSFSFGGTLQSIWAIKLNANGTLAWSRNWGGSSTISFKAKDIITLKDGGFAIAANVNDSTPAGDALVMRLTSDGSLVWSYTFNKGDDDGVNCLLEDGNNLYAGGHATVGTRQGILMQLSKPSGLFNWVKAVTDLPGQNEDVMKIEKITGGIAFADYSIDAARTYDNTGMLTFFKMLNNGTILYEHRAQPSTATGVTLEPVKTKMSADSGFTYIVTDTTNWGYGQITKVEGAIGGTVMPLTNNNAGGALKVRGFDLTGNYGYIIAGTENNFLVTSGHDKIKIIKMDEYLHSSSCSNNSYGSYIDDTAQFSITPFAWQKITATLPGTATQITPAVTTSGFTITDACADQECRNNANLGDQCNKAFLIDYNSMTPVYQFDHVKLPDGGYILAGGLSTVQPVITRLNAAGEIVWTRAVKDYYYSGFFKKAILTKDQNILLLGVTYIDVDHYAYDSTQLVKIDLNGNVIWSKYLHGATYDITETPDGGFCGVMNTLWGFPPIYSWVYKLDASGNILWQTELNHGGNDPHDAYYKAITVHNGNVYLGAQYYLYTLGYIHVLKFDEATGTNVWSKTLHIGEGDAYMEGLDVVNDTLRMRLNISTSTSPFSASTHFGVVSVPENGNPSGWQINSQNIVFPSTYFNEHIATHSAPMHDNTFVLAENSISNTGDSAVTITRTNLQGRVVWSKRYSNLHNYFVSSVKEDASDILISGKISTSYAGNPLWKPYLMRTDSTGVITVNATGNCANVAIAGTSQPLTVTLGDFANSTNAFSESHDIYSTNFYPHTYDINTFSEAGCIVPVQSNCNSLSITGNPLICNMADTIVYKGLRSAGCTSTIAWLTDTAYAIIKSTTDTTAKILFKKPGTTVLTAKLQNGCSIVNDTMHITIAKPSGVLNIGSDTTLCPGNTKSISAGTGFNSYKWQDGTADSVYSVTKPGVYYVTVTDFCNKAFTDTVHVTPAPPVPISLGPDLQKCNGDSLTLQAPAGFLNYSWGPGYNISGNAGNAVTVYPGKDTSYFVKAEKTPGCFGFDTIKIIVYTSPVINIGNDTAFCTGGSAIFAAPGDFASYLWSTGETGSSITASQAGAYTIKATTANGCNSYDTAAILAVYPLPVENIKGNTGICLNTTQTLDAGTGFASYAWNTGSTAQTISIADTGHYKVTVTDGNSCLAQDSLFVSTIHPLPQSFLFNDTAICSYQPINLVPTGSYKNYLWNNGETGPFINITKAGTYWLQITDNNNCVGTDTVNVANKQCTIGFYIPTAFTPNGDGKNDVFMPLVFGDVSHYAFTVYNRWGQVVFASKTPGTGWDGTFTGKAQPGENVFAWTCRYKLGTDPEQFKKGTVVLIR